MMLVLWVVGGCVLVQVKEDQIWQCKSTGFLSSTRQKQYKAQWPTKTITWPPKKKINK